MCKLKMVLFYVNLSKVVHRCGVHHKPYGKPVDIRAFVVSDQPRGARLVETQKILYGFLYNSE